MPDDVEALLFVDLTCDMLTVRLECRDNVQLGVAGKLATASGDGTSIDHDRRPVHATHGHDNTRHVLVAARNRDVGVVPLSTHDSLDRVGNQVPRLQRVAHALCAHGDAITDANGVELHALEASLPYTLCNLVGQVHEMHVAGISRVPHGGAADLGLVHVVLREARSIQHCLRGALRLGLCDEATGLVESIFRDRLSCLANELVVGRAAQPGGL